jgi:hypothetical protein
MSTAIFVIGVFVFLVTVYGTVVAGGLMLTGRQLDAQPELVSGPEGIDEHEGTIDRARRVIATDY